MLYKAVKLKASDKPEIFDATGGWARDAFFLAQQGFNITVVERVELIYRLLEDAYQRAVHQPQLSEIMSRITLIHADACTLLQKGLRSKVIYLDPMFPERSKSAKVKKDLQILQSIPETFGDVEVLFQWVRAATDERVVVKRPMQAPFLAEVRPDFQYLGKTVRFDVYLPKAN